MFCQGVVYYYESKLESQVGTRASVWMGVLLKRNELRWRWFCSHMSVGVCFEKKMALRSPPGPPYAARVSVWMGRV